MATNLDTPFALLRAYEDGLPGYLDRPRDRNMFLDSQPYQAYSEPNVAGCGAGQKALLWNYCLALDPTAFSERQTDSDCVSHGSRNARDIVRAVEILLKHEPESFLQRGATEPTYGARGHGGEGMSPATASQFERDYGFMVRQAYPTVDLSKYDSKIGANWGRSGVPEDIKTLCKGHSVGRITVIKSQNDLMDAMYNGYAAHSGQNAAWAAEPSKDNTHRRRSPGWNHDMAVVGYDDTKKHWPFRVWFIQNSWGAWNQPVKDWPADYGKQVPGMIVSSADDFQTCIDGMDCWIYGNIHGFPPQKLPNFGSVNLLEAK